MVTVIVFFASVLAMICFLIGMIFECFGEIIGALADTVMLFLKIIGIMILVVIGFTVLYEVVVAVEARDWAGLAYVAVMLVFLVMALSIMYVFFHSIGRILLSLIELIFTLLVSLTELIYAISLGCANVLKNGFERFLMTIVKRSSEI